MIMTQSIKIVLWTCALSFLAIVMMISLIPGLIPGLSP